MDVPGRQAGSGPRPSDADFSDYVHARWPRLVAALEAEGVAPDAARLAVAQVLVERRRGWARLVREEQVDLLVWEDVRRRLGLPPARTLPLDVETEPQALGTTDGPQEWLRRAESSLRRHRLRRLRRGAVVLALVAAALAALAWWDARPDPPAVRAEENPLPVTWYAAGELHLDEVVVELPGVDAFADWKDGVAVRHTDGRLALVDQDGDVDDLDEEPSPLARPPVAPSYETGPDDMVIQSVPLPDGGWAHLLDSSRREAFEEGLRMSETGRRAIVTCTAAGECGAPETVVVEGSTTAIRLR